MNVRDAAILALKEADRPLHAKEITERILSMGLWKTSGKTPVATVSAKLYSNIKRNGEVSPFGLHAPQTFVLRETETVSEAMDNPYTRTGSTQTPVIETKTYSFTDSAEMVLEAFGNKQPMHYREVTRSYLINMKSYSTMLNPFMQIIGDSHGTRPHRYPVGVYRAVASGVAQASGRPGPPVARFARSIERHSMDIAHRRSMVRDARSLSTVSDLPSPISTMAQSRCHGPTAGGVGTGFGTARQNQPGRMFH